jgi:zinc protease
MSDVTRSTPMRVVIAVVLIIAMLLMEGTMVPASYAQGEAARYKDDIALPPIKRVTLDNGLRVVAAEYQKLPLLELTLLISSGAVEDPPGKDGLASFVAGAIRRGTQKRGAQAFADAIEFLGADLDVSAGYQTTVVGAEFLAKDAGEGLSLVAEMIEHPAFADEEIRRERAETLAGLRARYENPAAIAGLCYARFLYGSHPFGRPVEGRSATVAGFSRKDIVGFYERYYRPNNAIAVVVGNLKADELIDRVRTAFGGWQRGEPPPAPPPAPTPSPSRRILLVDKPGATQAQITFGNVAISRLDPEWVTSQVSNTVFGGGFSSRLVEELRIKRSLTYGAWSAFVARREPGDFRVGTFTKVPTTAECVQVALSELGRFRAEPPKPEELEKARSYLRGQFPLQLQAPDALAGRLAEIEWLGLGFDEITAYRSRVAAVDAPTVAAFVKRAVPTPESVAIVIVGPAAEIAPTLDGLGPVETMTPEECLERD